MKTTKTIQKNSTCLVSDHAYRIILSKCMKVMIDRGVAAHIFAMTLLVVQKYLETGFPPIGGDDLIMELFHSLRPEMDLAIRRARSARKAAATRREKRQAETQPQQQPEPQRQQAAPTEPEEKTAPEAGASPGPGVARKASRRPSKGIRCPGIEHFSANQV